jgi:hypothetical protein
VTLVSLAYAFLSLETLRSKKNSILDASPDSTELPSSPGALGREMSTLPASLQE